MQLRQFRAVARLEHVTRAANELAVAQPALSRTIGRLETELGVPLFDRTGRQLRLNAYGRAFLARVEQALGQLDEGRRELSDMGGLAHGHIALAATTLRWVPELLAGFRAEQPDVRFRLIQTDTMTMRGLLERGECDLALCALPTDASALASVAVLSEEIMLAVPARHHLAQRGRIDLSEAADEPFIGLKPGYDMRDDTDAFCRAAGFEPRLVCEVDEPAAIRALVRAGLGVAFLPAASWRVNADLEVVAVHISRPECRRTLGLAWHRDRYLSLAARAFREFVVEYYAALNAA